MKVAKEINGKNKVFKSVLIYIFLLYVGYVISDLVLLKFVRPLFIAKLSAKDSVGGGFGFEPKTEAFTTAEIGAMSTYTDRTLSRNIFNSGEMPKPWSLMQKSSDTNEEEFEENEPVQTSLSLTLEGTAVHRNPFRSLATVRGESLVSSYTVGDEIEGLAEVISVLRKKMIFRNLQNKRLEFIEISRSKIRASRPLSKRTKKFGKRPAQKGVVKRSGNHFSAKRSDVNKYLSDYRSLLKQANSRPVKDPATGEFLGFQIFSIKPGSIFEQLGLENGDTIGSVNGQPITNIGQAMSLFNKLKNANDIEINVTKDSGEERSLSYSIE